MIRFSCPGCGATYSVDDAKGGKTGKCPKCQSQFLIPAAEGGAAPPPLPKSPPAPAADPNAPVEIAPCPKCDARLSVAASDVGVDVECPYCKTVYTAKKAGSAAVPAPKSRPGAAGGRAARDEDDDRPSRRRRDEDDEVDDRPSKRSRRRDDDEEEADERPSKRGRRDDEEEEERPSRRRDDDEDRPRKKKKKRRRGGGEPHRGGLILTLGILSFVMCGIFTAIPAWTMGRADLAKMDEGSMDEEGRSMTQIGMYLGMASCILSLVGFAFYCVIAIIAGVGGAAGK